ncbi:MAG TPA: LysR family transcriptional regulator [Euzebyales bacterium]|nr:LysR family transcriptional regulator [Euzebyales bacterium]
MLDIARLRVLVAVAEHGSVTAAAKALHFAQPSVSHHLARLQAETGVQLVTRVGRGIRLTPEGETLARRAAEIIGRVESAEAELAVLAGLRTGRVRVAAFQSALSVWVPPAAAALRRRHPDLELRLTDAHPTMALRWLRDGEVDVAILFRYDDTVPDDEVRYDHIADDPMYLLSLRHGDTLTDHRDAAWIAGCEHCRRDFVDICETAGFTPNIAYSSDDIIVDQALVAAGLGVTTMPGLALRSYHTPGVQATALAGHRRRIYVATYGDPPDPPATSAFVAALRTAVTHDDVARGSMAGGPT